MPGGVVIAFIAFDCLASQETVHIFKQNNTLIITDRPVGIEVGCCLVLSVTIAAVVETRYKWRWVELSTSKPIKDKWATDLKNGQNNIAAQRILKFYYWKKIQSKWVCLAWFFKYHPSSIPTLQIQSTAWSSFQRSQRCVPWTDQTHCDDEICLCICVTNTEKIQAIFRYILKKLHFQLVPYLVLKRGRPF